MSAPARRRGRAGNVEQDEENAAPVPPVIRSPPPQNPLPPPPLSPPPAHQAANQNLPAANMADGFVRMFQLQQEAIAAITRGQNEAHAQGNALLAALNNMTAAINRVNAAPPHIPP